MARRKNAEKTDESLESVTTVRLQDEPEKNDEPDKAREDSSQEHWSLDSNNEIVRKHVTVSSGNTVTIYQEPKRNAQISGYFPHGVVGLQKSEHVDPHGKAWIEIECESVAGWVEQKYLRGV